LAASNFALFSPVEQILQISVLAHTESLSPPAKRFIYGLTGKTAENAKKTGLKWKMNFY
jgi:hypothetical protein